MIEDRWKTRRAAASHTSLIALLAMVVFGVITVGEVKEFDLFLAPLVALVTGATPITSPESVSDSGTRRTCHTAEKEASGGKP